MENKILIPIAILVIGMCLAMLIAIRSIKTTWRIINNK